MSRQSLDRPLESPRHEPRRSSATGTDGGVVGRGRGRDYLSRGRGQRGRGGARGPRSSLDSRGINGRTSFPSGGFRGRGDGRLGSRGSRRGGGGRIGGGRERGRDNRGGTIDDDVTSVYSNPDAHLRGRYGEIIDSSDRGSADGDVRSTEGHGASQMYPRDTLDRETRIDYDGDGRRTGRGIGRGRGAYDGGRGRSLTRGGGRGRGVDFDRSGSARDTQQQQRGSSYASMAEEEAEPGEWREDDRTWNFDQPQGELTGSFRDERRSWDSHDRGFHQPQPPSGRIFEPKPQPQHLDFAPNRTADYSLMAEKPPPKRHISPPREHGEVEEGEWRPPPHHLPTPLVAQVGRDFHDDRSIDWRGPRDSQGPPSRDFRRENQQWQAPLRSSYADLANEPKVVYSPSVPAGFHDDTRKEAILSPVPPPPGRRSPIPPVPHPTRKYGPSDRPVPISPHVATGRVLMDPAGLGMPDFSGRGRGARGMGIRSTEGRGGAGGRGHFGHQIHPTSFGGLETDSQMMKRKRDFDPHIRNDYVNPHDNLQRSHFSEDIRIRDVAQGPPLESSEPNLTTHGPSGRPFHLDNIPGRGAPPSHAPLRPHRPPSEQFEQGVPLPQHLPVNRGDRGGGRARGNTGRGFFAPECRGIEARVFSRGGGRHGNFGPEQGGGFPPPGRGFPEPIPVAPPSADQHMSVGPPPSDWQMPVGPPSADWQILGGSYAMLAEQSQPVSQRPVEVTDVPPPVMQEEDSVIIKEEEAPPKPLTPPRSPPPEPSPPSALVVALSRLVEAESQMDYAFAKHLQLIRKRKLLRAEIDRLEKLPVGADAFKDDLDKFIADLEESTGVGSNKVVTIAEEERSP